MSGQGDTAGTERRSLRKKLARPIANTLSFLLPRMSRVLPVWTKTVAADWIGTPALRKKRANVMEKMKAVLGAEYCRDANGVEHLARRHSRYFGRVLIEAAEWQRMSREQIRRQITVDGEEFLEESLAHGSGAILLANHMGHPLCVPAGLGVSRSDLYVASKQWTPPWVDRYYVAILRNIGCKEILVDDNLYRGISRVLEENGVVVIALDDSVPSKRARTIPFGSGGIEINPAPVIFALRRGTPAHFVTTGISGPTEYRLRIHPQISSDHSGDIEEKAEWMVEEGLRLLYEEIQRSPAEWWGWSHGKVRKYLIQES